MKKVREKYTFENLENEIRKFIIENTDYDSVMVWTHFAVGDTIPLQKRKDVINQIYDDRKYFEDILPIVKDFPWKYGYQMKMSPWLYFYALTSNIAKRILWK